MFMLVYCCKVNNGSDEFGIAGYIALEFVQIMKVLSICLAHHSIEIYINCNLNFL